MHLYVLAKGIKPSLEKWQNDLLAQYLPVKTGKDKKGAIQFSVRPVQLFELGFPEDQLEYVMSIVGTGDYILKRYPILHKLANIVRRVFKLKRVPIPKKVNQLMQPNQVNKAVAIVPIGLKKDKFVKKKDDSGEWLHEQL